MRKFLAISTGLVAVAMAMPSYAATVVTDYTAWLSGINATACNAAASCTETTTFGSVGSSPSSITLGDGQAIVIGSADPIVIMSTGGGAGTAVWTSISNYSGQVIDTSYPSETVNFSPNVQALGFFVVPDGAGTGSVTATLSDNTAGTSKTMNFTASTPQFIGFYGGDESSISIAFSLYDSNSDPVAINDFVIGDIVDATGVPEPVSMAVLLTGITGLSLARRRRV